MKVAGLLEIKISPAPAAHRYDRFSDDASRDCRVIEGLVVDKKSIQE
jgi:hypothetical protein